MEIRWGFNWISNWFKSVFHWNFNWISNRFWSVFHFHKKFIEILTWYPIDFYWYFLNGCASEEIQISAAETRIAFLLHQTLFVKGGWRHPASPAFPKHTPGQWSLSYENCTPDLKKKGRVGGHKQFLLPEELQDQLVPSWIQPTRPLPTSFNSCAEILLFHWNFN